jgi:DNA repair exonuclease SbcCD ATPase subunit
MVLVVLAAVIAGREVLKPPPPTVEQASAALATTERELAAVVTETTITSGALDRGLDTPQGLSQELQNFDHNTQRLARLLAELAREIRAYDAARTQRMAAFNQELAAIKDSTTRRRVEHLRARASAMIRRRLARSRAALAALHTVVERGADVRHAARCVQLAHDLEVQGSDLRAQVQFTRQEVAEYARLTTTFLARLTTSAETTE